MLTAFLDAGGFVYTEFMQKSTTIDSGKNYQETSNTHSTR